jgi:hypothetical protein
MGTRNKVEPETVTEEFQMPEDAQPGVVPDEKDEIIKSLRAQIEAMKQTGSQPAQPELLPADHPLGNVWDDYIDAVVPRHGRGQEKCFYVSVNGQNAQIPADGKMQHIRKPLALALQASLEAEARAEQFAEDLPHDAAPASFAELMSVINDLKNKLRSSGITV